MPERGIRGWIARGWYNGQRRVWLAPLAVLFGLFIFLRRKAYQNGIFSTVRPGVPVIVIGNITAGGTGKTPLVVWLAAQLQEQGYKVGVVLRGYGGSAAAPQRVTADSDPDEVGDEAVMIARRIGCSVAVARHRPAAAAMLEAEGVEVLLSDDGLQHLALARDVEIAVIDGMRGLGNGCLLPQGPLRERADRLGRVSAVVINGREGIRLPALAKEPLSMSLEVDALCAVTDDARLPLATLGGARVHAVAGIGNPARFFSLLREQGCEPVQHEFADHHAFAARDLDFPDDLPIVMTEKDAVKCRHFASRRMQYLRVSARLSDADAARLMRLVQGCLKNGEHKHA